MHLQILALIMMAYSCGGNEEITENSNNIQEVLYKMPEESDPHEGTWLQWPHHYQHGITYRNELDATWVAITNALQSSEKVHIIAYDTTEKNRIISLLNNASVPLLNVDFTIHHTDDVWVRDNGPIYVKDKQGNIVIEDWGFNGWGGKYDYTNCNAIPLFIAQQTGKTKVDLNNIMINEGGSVEIDGHGVLMATKSSVISQSPANSVRNPGMSQVQAEANFTKYLGVTKFIWLDGGFSSDDVTDMHIDGFARFAPGNKLVTMSNSDLANWGLSASDIDKLNNATNKNNTAYTKVVLPLTQNNVTTQTGVALTYKGSYINYYISNGKVLVPNYNDPNDTVANNIIAGLYPGRTVVGIDVRNLYQNGGMVHCVTQQQPL
ncbi:agmatine deiminase family protein [Flavobacterium amnicola]|nr:agmatine deiminase family protein [Flavobacterium amnicola]